MLLAPTDMLVNAIDILHQSLALFAVNLNDTTLRAAVGAGDDFDGISSTDIHGFAMTNDECSNDKEDEELNDEDLLPSSFGSCHSFVIG